jgi:hypothetical protein
MFLVAIVLFSLPSVVGALTYTSPVSGSQTSMDMPAGNITFVSTQGTSTQVAAGVYGINTGTKEIVWSNTSCPEKCYDVDPLGNNSILFVSKTASRYARDVDNPDEYHWYATRMNWRTGNVQEQFAVPPDTHDVDYIGDGKYLVANKVSTRNAEEVWMSVAKTKGWIDESRENHSDLMYTYDAEKDDIVWEYDFGNHFPLTAGEDGDYTHLNDVDVVENGSAILASPRNFDRVVLIDRSTKETEWVLGEEGNYSILNRQHNPALLSTDPPTVLVADSENDRVVEYRKDGERWVRTWKYSGDLSWPRDADRLPNGNTLVVDTRGDRILEVTPQKEIVWERDVPRMPYDVERLQYGDESTGPPMHTLSSDNGPNASERSQAVDQDQAGVVGSVGTMWNQYYSLSGWVFPPWIQQSSFAALHFSVLAVLGWAGFELRRWRR